MKIELTNNTPVDVQYKDSKEFLDKQQAIDLLIALARVTEVLRPDSYLDKMVATKIENTLQKL